MKKLFVILALMFTALAARPQQSCTYATYNNQYVYTCGVPTNEFEFMRANSINRGAQIQSNWCWAACVQMVLNYHGLYVSQVDVVNRIYGSQYINKPANEPQILRALTGWAADYRGRYSNINAYGGQTNVQEIVSALAGKWPLIVGLTNPGSPIGHAFVLTAITYTLQYDQWGRFIGYVPISVTVRDPWPNNPSRQVMEWKEFSARVFMALKVWVTRM